MDAHFHGHDIVLSVKIFNAASATAPQVLPAERTKILDGGAWGKFEGGRKTDNFPSPCELSAIILACP
jgi:hypothetical protein